MDLLVYYIKSNTLCPLICFQGLFLSQRINKDSMASFNPSIFIKVEVILGIIVKLGSNGMDNLFR